MVVVRETKRVFFSYRKLNDRYEKSPPPPPPSSSPLSSSLPLRSLSVKTVPIKKRPCKNDNDICHCYHQGATPTVTSFSINKEEAEISADDDWEPTNYPRKTASASTTKKRKRKIILSDDEEEEDEDETDFARINFVNFKKEWNRSSSANNPIGNNGTLDTRQGKKDIIMPQFQPFWSILDDYLDDGSDLASGTTFVPWPHALKKKVSVMKWPAESQELKNSMAKKSSETIDDAKGKRNNKYPQSLAMMVGKRIQVHWHMSDGTTEWYNGTVQSCSLDGSEAVFVYDEAESTPVLLDNNDLPEWRPICLAPDRIPLFPVLQQERVNDNELLSTFPGAKHNVNFSSFSNDFSVSDSKSTTLERKKKIGQQQQQPCSLLVSPLSLARNEAKTNTSNTIDLTLSPLSSMLDKNNSSLGVVNYNRRAVTEKKRNKKSEKMQCQQLRWNHTMQDRAMSRKEKEIKQQLQLRQARPLLPEFSVSSAPNSTTTTAANFAAGEPLPVWERGKKKHEEHKFQQIQQESTANIPAILEKDKSRKYPGGQESDQSGTKVRNRTLAGMRVKHRQSRSHVARRRHQFPPSVKLPTNTILTNKDISTGK